MNSELDRRDGERIAPCASQDPLLSCRNLWKVYGPTPCDLPSRLKDASSVETLTREITQAGGFPAVADVSFDVPRGEIFVIMGLSGSGKSTLIRCLSRLVTPTAGAVMFEGIDLSQCSTQSLTELRRRKIGMVFQHFGLIPHLSVIENVAFPLRLQGVEKRRRLETAAEMIDLVGLAGRERAYPHELSGGQQQRVGIARSLASDPDLWLLDEPFSALDPLIRKQMQDEFLRLQRMLHKTIIFITHDFLEAVRLGDRIALMRDGRFVQVGRPIDILLAPADDYVRAFGQDVPRIKAIRARDLVRAGDASGFLRSVPEEATLEDLLVEMSGGDEGLSVRASDGRPLGVVLREDALRAVGGAAHGGLMQE